jgi:hypothetical protein
MTDDVQARLTEALWRPVGPREAERLAATVADTVRDLMRQAREGGYRDGYRDGIVTGAEDPGRADDLTAGMQP